MVRRLRTGMLFALLVGLALLIAACNRSAPTPTPTPVPPTPTPMPTKSTVGEEVEVKALLQQAMEALEAGDVTAARNALRSALTATTDPAMRVALEEALTALEQDKSQEAQERLAKMLGLTVAPAKEEDGHQEGEEAGEGELALSGAAKEGYELYQQVGCAQCHGAQGEGGVGPPLAGHTPDAIIRQVRNPVGAMPAYPPERLSDEDLNKIVAFIQALGEAAEHAHAPEELTTAQAHMLMTLLTLEDNALDDAQHHIEHAITLSEDTTVQERLRKALDLLVQGEQHDAEHEIQELVGTVAPEKNVTLKQLHLQLIESSLQENDLAETEHHLQHFIDLASVKEKEIAQDVLTAVQQGDLNAAETRLQELTKGNEDDH